MPAAPASGSADGSVAEIPAVEATVIGPRSGDGAEIDQKDEDERIKAFLDRQRAKVRSKLHLFTHTPVCESCEGCMVKARQKLHYKKSFDRDADKYETTITMDQLTNKDQLGIVGYGGIVTAVSFARFTKTIGHACLFAYLKQLKQRELP